MKVEGVIDFGNAEEQPRQLGIVAEAGAESNRAAQDRRRRPMKSDTPATPLNPKESAPGIGVRHIILKRRALTGLGNNPELTRLLFGIAEIDNAFDLHGRLRSASFASPIESARAGAPGE
jgi:hypothetical protein